MSTDALTTSQVRSLRLHAAVIEQLGEDPERVMATARTNIARWLPAHRWDGRTAAHLRDWLDILDTGADQVVAVLGDVDEYACELPANSPFAGVISEERRRLVFDTIRPGEVS